MLTRLIFASLLGVLSGLVLQPPSRFYAPPHPAAQFNCNVVETGSDTVPGYDSVHLGCSYLADSRPADRISIYSQEHLSLRPGIWTDIPKLEDETWIFDAQSDGTPELVIRFYKSQEKLIADLYDRQAMGGIMEDAELLSLAQTQPPIVRVSTTGPWQLGGGINYNLDILVDGTVLAVPGDESLIRDRFAYDGSPDVIIRVRDLDFDGRPDFDLRTIPGAAQDNQKFPDTPISYLMVNAEDNEAPLQPVLPWPYLGNLTYGYLTSSPHTITQPPIQIDWQAGKIYAIGEFVSSRGNDSQWFVYSFSEIDMGVTNNTDFESPFAWYDLAGDQDRQPELAVRFTYYPRFDPVFVDGTSDDPVNLVRYSWDQDNDGLWDYKLGLLGKHEITTHVTLADIGLRILPYEKLPGWVNSQEWGAVTFVAAEDGGTTGEGIYIWDHPAWFTEGYFLGRQDNAIPLQEDSTSTAFGYDRIPAGYRGEFNNEYLDQVRLYYSPVDRRIHLKNLTEGFWNLDDRQFIRYRSITGEYVDQWERYLDNELLETMYYLSGYLLKVHDNSLEIYHANLPLSAGEFAPPSNKQEWEALGELVNQDAQLDSVVYNRFLQGTTYSNIQVEHLRPTKEGFRVELSCDGNTRISGTDILGIRDLASGLYVLQYSGQEDAFQLIPAHSANPLLLELKAMTEPITYQPTHLRLHLDNPGELDLEPLTLKVLVDTPAGWDEIASKEISLQAGENSLLDVVWVPRSAGEHEIITRLYENHDNLVLNDLTTIRVTDSGGGILRITGVSSPGSSWAPALILLLITALIAGVFWRVIEVSNESD